MQIFACIIVIFLIVLQGQIPRADEDIMHELLSESCTDSGAALSGGQAVLGYAGLLGSQERSRQIRGGQLFKMLVMLLFHFHELCCNPHDRPASFTESQRALPSTPHCIWPAKDFWERDALFLPSFLLQLENKTLNLSKPVVSRGAELI